MPGAQRVCFFASFALFAERPLRLNISHREGNKIVTGELNARHKFCGSDGTSE